MLLHEASLLLSFWSFACQHAAYLINRLPTKLLLVHFHIIKLFGAASRYASLGMFGCTCYSWLNPYTSHNLEPRSTLCVYLGFSKVHYAHQCLYPIKSKFFISCNVRFFENLFPLHNIQVFWKYFSPSQYSHILKVSLLHPRWKLFTLPHILKLKPFHPIFLHFIFLFMFDIFLPVAKIMSPSPPARIMRIP